MVVFIEKNDCEIRRKMQQCYNDRNCVDIKDFFVILNMKNSKQEV